MDLATVDRGIDDAAGLLPSAGELAGIVPGCHVRLGLQDGVRFWARVIDVRESGYVAVALGTLPEDIVKLGDVCFFDRRHVFGLVSK